MNITSYLNVVDVVGNILPVMSVINHCAFEIMGRAIKIYIVENIHMPVMSVTSLLVGRVI
jgi:hypothetical protein